MLQTVTIQNFKSLKDVAVNLQRVNLLIGPNNSGKSNFLKALTFVKQHLNFRIQYGLVDLGRIYYKQNLQEPRVEKEPIMFSFRWNNGEVHVPYTVYQLELMGYTEDRNMLKYSELIGASKQVMPLGSKIGNIDGWIKHMYDFNVVFENNESFFNKDLTNKTLLESWHRDKQRHCFYCKQGSIVFDNTSFGYGGFLKAYEGEGEYLSFGLVAFFNSVDIYSIKPDEVSKEQSLELDKHMNTDGSNLISFLDNMRDEHSRVWNAIERDLRICMPEFEGINFAKVKLNGSESLGKRFGLRDKFDKTYWASELSEGTIYFLALLAIIHQPNPPKLLLLEEPEKGIHPRRISEVMNLIFRLAEEKDIQIILTTHSTQVVDEFQDIPESVFVFELQEGETKVKNLLTDIIEPDNKRAEVNGYQKLDFNKHSLGEHWAIGFLGGVPAK